MQVEYYMLIALVCSISILLGVVSYTTAQTIPEDRLFVKGESFTDLDGILYSNGEELSFDRTGYITEQIVIHRWNDIDTTQKTIITSRLISLGYEDRGLIRENDVEVTR